MSRELQSTSRRVFGSATLREVHAIGAMPGRVPSTALPASSTATHRSVTGHDTATMGESLDESAAVTFQAPMSPVGLRETRALPASSTATQKVSVAHETS